MHEFALAQEIVATITNKVTGDLCNIQSIDIDVGAFSGVVVDSLDFGLKALFEEESITDIQVNITTIPTIAACECGNQYQLKEIFETCPHCQSFNRKLMSGTDIIIKSVELRDNPGHDDPDDRQHDDEEMDSEQRQTLATMAHEIKAPLSAIISMLSVIDRGYVTDPKKSKELVGRAKNKAEVLMRMLNDILDFYMLSDKTHMKRERLDIYQILKDSISMMKPYAQQRNVSLLFKGTCQNERLVHGNYTFLLRVFNNLIMNAIKYNKEKGKIEFTCLVSPQEESIIIKIRDTGIGIAEEDLERVFNIFERGKTARKNIDGSLGLGLSLVKQIIEDHEGSIKISSTVNVGTTVTVTLPLVN